MPNFFLINFKTDTPLANTNEGDFYQDFVILFLMESFIAYVTALIVYSTDNLKTFLCGAGKSG